MTIDEEIAIWEAQFLQEQADFEEEFGYSER